MKKLTKPIFSPGRRCEKFPPPLLRFLRSNVGSKSSSSSGRRPRASHLFIRKKNAVIETTQEPSSPKVTCIGQVRVRRTKKNKKTTTFHRRPSHRICRCLRELKPRWFCCAWSKWVSFFRCGFCKNSRDLSDSSAIEGTPKSELLNAARNNGEEDDDDDDRVSIEADGINQGLISGLPPRNALLLTRCRSAPYRSSSLASKLWESTMDKRGEEEIAKKIDDLKIKKGEEEVTGNANEGLNEEDKCIHSNGVEELKVIKVASSILIRCKSEPARTWDQLLV